jgi:hypothetical protein
MSATAITHPGSAVGERRELGRYTTAGGELRLVVGQRVAGVVRVSDVPASGRGRAYLIERGLEQDGNAALTALVAAYLADADRYGETPMGAHYLERYLEGPR